MLKLFSQEFRQTKPTPRAGERPPNPGRFKRVRQSVRKLKFQHKRRQQKLKFTEAKLQKLQNLRDKTCLAIEKLQSTIQGLKDEIDDTTQKMEEEAKALPRHMRSPKKRKQQQETSEQEKTPKRAKRKAKAKAKGSDKDSAA
jgi:hypothetical protein